MRVVRVVRDGEPRTCVLDGSDLVPIERPGGRVPQAWEVTEGDPATFVPQDRLPSGGHSLLPPAEPAVVLSAEDNFTSQPRSRKTGLAAARPAAIEPFRRPDPAEDVWLIPRDPRSLATPGEPMPLPHGCTQLDAGVALAAVIGSCGVIAGYCVAIDVVRRDVPVEHAYLARSHPGHTVLGPELYTVDELSQPTTVELALDVDGHPRQRSLLSEMVVPAPVLVESIRRRYPLLPGDVVLLGTPPGIALDRGHGWILDGSVLRATITGLGEVEAMVAAERR